jgi:membrane-bound lytic murein transglycosylase A
VRWAAALGALACAAILPAWSRPAAASYRLEPLAFSDLEGWAADDHSGAYAAFRRSCLGSRAGLTPTLRPICREAAARPVLAAAGARSFFERHFRPERVVPENGAGFLTGYFEPEYRGSLTPTGTFTTPLLARPQRDHGSLPERAAIEAGALGRRAHSLVYLDPVEAFVVHVQGSARIRLPDDRVIRVGFAGRNGQPYTAIGRVLSQREGIPPAQMGLAGLMAWLRAHPDRAAVTMRLNKSYIFFRRLPASPSGTGPIGGAGVALTPGRSLAIDRKVWSYGLPVWLEGELARPDGATDPFRRLVVAQDTGAAIVGPARGDLFMGTGPDAGAQAGAMRHAVRFIVLRPRRD